MRSVNLVRSFAVTLFLITFSAALVVAQAPPLPEQPRLPPMKSSAQPQQEEQSSREQPSREQQSRQQSSLEQSSSQDAPKLSPSDRLIKEAFEVSKNAESIDDYTRIIDLTKEAVDRGAEHKAYARKLSSWAHNRRGEKYADAGREREALSDFEAAVTLDPASWRALHNRGVSKASIGDLKSAIADFDRTIQMNPDFANAWFNRAELKYDQADFSGAARDYTRAIQLQPGDAGFYNSRGHSYYRLGQFREALSDYNRAVQINPDDAAALVNRGDAFREQGIYVSAAADFREAIRLNPKLGRAYVSAAWLMVTCPDSRFRNPELGLQAAQKAIELDGDRDYRYLDTLAAAYANSGEFTEAKTSALKALNKAPTKEKEKLQKRIDLYEKQQAFRDGGPAEPVRAASRTP